MRIRIINGSVILKNALLNKATILIDGSKISRIGKNTGSGGRYLTIDARNCFVSPGFIDTHIHGDAEKIFRSETKSGTTSAVIAESCDRLDKIYKEIDSIRAFVGNNPFGPNILGVRLEGPYINKKKRGAQDGRYVRRPDKNELTRILRRAGGILKIMTIAPELKGANVLVRLLNRNKIVASLGHSDASFDEACSGTEAGISHATHIFNAMRGVDRRDPGAACAALLDDRITAEIILDLVHVSGALFNLLLKIKGVDKVILITDSIRHTGSPYRLPSGRPAGSSLTMIEALRNAVKVTGISLPEAVRLASYNPAKLLGLEKRKGAVVAGKDADIVIFDRDFDVKMTIVNGEIVYRKKGF